MFPFKDKKNKDQKPLAGFSPLVILGIFAILVPLFVLMTLDNIREQHDRIKEKLTGKGLFLIRAFEAGTRTGMVTTRWGAKRVQRLLTETAGQPEIVYMMITDAGGTILAHSDVEMIGQVYEDMPGIEFVPGQPPLFYRELIRGQEKKVFEVYKAFTPARDQGRYGRHSRVPPECSIENGPGRRCLPAGPPGHRSRGEGAMPMNGDWFQSHFESDGGNGARCRQVIFAALDMANVEKMKQQTVRHAIVMGGLFFALGAAGLVCLVIFQGYRSARSSLSRIRAFSGEVIANMPAGLITLDTDLEITSHNDAAMEILGDRKNRPGTMVLPPEMAGMVTRLGEKGKKMAGEIQCTVLSDPPLLLDVTASTICSGGGAVSGYLFLFHDLTELKTLKQEIDRSRRLAAVGKLAAGVAHEIRNPLSSIKGFATYFFERDGALQADRDVARIMVQEVERLNRAVTQLLEFARPVPVEKKKVAIETIVGHSLRLIAHDLEKHNVSVKTRIDTARTHLHTDPDRVNQILLNLYLNALQAMDKAGELSVTVREGPHENRVIIEVADTGRGIPGKDLDHIFDPYFTTRSDGTGLGLAMVYRAVEALGGEIRIQSVPGQGTRVVIELPAG